MAHGNSKAKFVAKDDKHVCLKADVFHQVNNDNCKAFKGKPKVFFINTCRGGTRELGLEADGEEETDGKMQLTKRTDFFYYYSTLKGSVSWRDPTEGSWMMSELVSVWRDETVLEDNSNMTYTDKLNVTQSIQQITIISIETDEGVLEPLGVGEISIEVRY